MKSSELNISRIERRRVGALISAVAGCKWSLSILHLISTGVVRPGAIERSLNGLSAKVLTDCARKLTRYGLLEKHSYAEVPPRVEYEFTPLGLRFFHALEDLNKVEAQLMLTSKRLKEI